MSKQRAVDAESVELVPEDQFREFVRRVVSVPKKVIDRELALTRKRRGRTPKRRAQHG